MLKFEVWQSKKDDEWYWRLWSQGEIVATSGEGHASKQKCLDEIDLVKSANWTTPVNITESISEDIA